MGALPPRLALSTTERRNLVDVARGRARADLVLSGSRVVNVYTDEVEPAEVAIVDGRIAWVGARRGPAPHEERDFAGAVLVPGLIEPHGHPDILYTPSELIRAVGPRGTTTICADPVALQMSLNDEELDRVLGSLAQASVKLLWTPRAGFDGAAPGEVATLPLARLVDIWDRTPGTTSSGEMTAWTRLLTHDERLTAFIEHVVSAGGRVDGHAAGASPGTLGALAAAGISSDHEAISAQEALARLRLGLWTMVRHSSLRPDGDALARGLVELGTPLHRVLLTTDGPVATDVTAGYLDAVVRTVIGAGIPATTAVRMATLHPATYLGLDGHLGGIAPGRCADLLVVDALETFAPLQAFCDGVAVAEDNVDVGFDAWRELPATRYRPAPLDADGLAALRATSPRIRFEGVITRDDGSALSGGEGLAALVSRDGDWIVTAAVSGPCPDAFASTFSGSRHVVLLGKDLPALASCYHRAIELGGGLVTPGAEVSLPILGRMSSMRVPELGRGLAEVERTLGEPGTRPPVAYVSLFMDLAVLPDVRLTPDGVLAVKSGALLADPVQLRASKP
ncbi:adenine deaminase [Nitriliruptoraceae bacterium ZYF776]|nr:adenine deaminase [Profundirhabdus halotolerans]